MKAKLNQKLINLIEYYNLINADIIFKNAPIDRSTKLKTLNLEGSKSEKLNKLKNLIKNIKNCELKESSNNMVFADGNIQSKIMIIGEGPGAKEDEVGLPFVGRAGQLLDKMLAAINLDNKGRYEYENGNFEKSFDLYQEASNFLPDEYSYYQNMALNKKLDLILNFDQV